LVENKVREARCDGKCTERCEDMDFLPASCEKQAMFALSPLCYIVELNLAGYLPPDPAFAIGVDEQ
jgi:hypothetical protein